MAQCNHKKKFIVVPMSDDRHRISASIRSDAREIVPSFCETDVIETAWFFDGYYNCYTVTYVANGDPPDLFLINYSRDTEIIDCGLDQRAFGPGDAMTLSSIAKNGYEAKMKKDGVRMPWIKKKKKKRCHQCKKYKFVKLPYWSANVINIL